MKQVSLFCVALFACTVMFAPALAYNANGRWTTTASGVVGPLGTPVTLTWSLVPDGTFFQGASGQSNLIATLDTWFGSGPGGAEYTQRPWFTRFEQCFDRWGQLGGVTFEYQVADDGSPHGNLQGNGLRGDIRFGGKNIDGDGGTYGSAWFIPNSDITIDTGDFGHFTTATNNYRDFRNTVSHEIGHALGLGHILPNAGNFLLEGAFSSDYDGPQFDDIRGIQYQYGDAYEKTNGGLGNNTIENATEIGTILSGNTVVVGADGTTGIRVSTVVDDFVSISNSNDFDFYSFTLAGPSLVDFNLSPVGPTFNQKIGSGPTLSINSMSISNLSLQVYSLVEGSPTLLASADVNPAGMGELISDFALEEVGQYFVRIAGSATDVQLYRLSLAVETLELSQPGDFDDDGDVDGTDFLLWQRGQSSDPLSAGDLIAWQDNYGMASQSAATATVPEPSSWTLFLALIPATSYPARIRSLRFTWRHS